MNRRLIILLLCGSMLVLPLGGCKNAEPAIDTPPASETTKEETMKPANTTTAEEAQMPTQAAITSVSFPTTDNLTITGDLYWTGDAYAPFILLFHQADYSRGEYKEIAPKLNVLGYNCLAVDQRSGGATNGVINETFKAAKAAGLPTGYTNAYPDLESALSYVKETYAPPKLIVWGSSYSSSLALILASEHPNEVSAVLAFSPGEYFKLGGESVSDYAANITQPAFITSAKSEEKAWRSIAEKITSSGCVFFVPQGNGRHGSSALYEKTPSNAEYWTTVEAFLSSLK